MKQTNSRTLLCVFALILLALVGVVGWVVNGAKPAPKPQTKKVPAAAVTTAVVKQSAHPAEAELNKFGFTSKTVIGVQAGYRNQAEGGAK